MRQQVQGEEEFPDEAQSRDCVEVVYNRKSLVLLIKTTGEDLFNDAKMENELLQRHLIEGVQTPMIKGDRL
jgi:hypothetical protein